MEFHVAEDMYNMIWTDQALSIKEIKTENQSTKINHFPEITQITRKNKMAINLNAMKTFFTKQYSFYPETWILPSDYHKLMKKHTKGKVYISKPQNGCQGQGIYLLDNPNKLQKQSNEIVQQYIMNPLLINGLKFDMRIYVLITCVNPLRIYLYKDGIARFATQKFEKPDSSNMENNFSHLTNYAINKFNQNFMVDDNNPNVGHKRLISSIFKNQEYTELMKKIGKIVIKTIISGLPFLQNAYSQCKKVDPSSCFQLLGFDIILTDKKEPILLEVNQNPSLVTDTQMDHKLKSQLVKNIFEMVTGGYSTLNEEKIDVKIKMKDRHEMCYKNNFDKLFPCPTLEQTEQYDDLILKANTIYKDKYGINVIRNFKRSKDNSKLQQSLLWNEQPYHYTKQKVERVYGIRNSKTSNFKKRLIFT